MGERTFEPGDEVTLSARYLRAMNTIRLQAGSSGLSEHDRGIGVVLDRSPTCPEFYYVRFPTVARIDLINGANLVCRSRIHLEASASEHNGGASGYVID